MVPNYTWTFLQDLSEIEAYIALDNPMKAIEVIEEMKHFCRNEIIKTPHQGKILNQHPETREAV
jgi:hypothetical protein